MAEITASLVKALRDSSGVGMMDCKKALQETGGDLDAAVDRLRAKGLSRAAKKADRVASEGLIAVAVRAQGAGMQGALIELNAETDFVARNERFQSLAHEIADVALTADGSVEDLRATALKGSETVTDGITHLISTIGENMVLRRSAKFTVTAGVVGSYVHGAVAGAPQLGRIGVLVALESDGERALLEALGRNIAMHVAAAKPLALSVEELDPALVAREKTIFTEQAAGSGKPPAVIEKMVEGRLRKFYEEAVLLKQAYVRDPDQTIEQLVAATAKSVGAPIRVTGFARFGLGEGVEKDGGDLAG